jgi:hypothetical protein
MTTTPFKSVVSITKQTIPSAMIEGIRRRLGRSINQDPWDADQELVPEVEGNTKLPTDTAVPVAARQENGEFSPQDEETQDYYKNLVSTAIQNGGWLEGHQIPIPWLRMILAGLEMKHIEPEMMWYGVEVGSAGGEFLSRIPSYHALFPSDPDVSTER